MISVYIEKEIFEQIVLYPEDTPNWHGIFHVHARIFINLTKSELVEEEVEGTPIFEFIKASGGTGPIALQYYFDSIYEDNSIIANKPRSAFFLKVQNEEAIKLQQEYGVIVQTKQTLDDNILTGAFYKELRLKTRIDNGWKELLRFNRTPLNSLIISDQFIFQNTEDKINLGIFNIIAFLDGILPDKLNIDFHLLIIANDGEKTENACRNITNELSEKIKSLREYPILIEMVFCESKLLHRRTILMNYLSIVSDHGFAIFSVNDGTTVRQKNNFRAESMFVRMLPDSGDTVFDSDSILLSDFLTCCEGVLQYIQNAAPGTNRRMLADCIENQPVRNRLLNSLE